jgi:hypothetical protein
MLRTAMGKEIAAARTDPTVIEVMVNPDHARGLDRAGDHRTGEWGGNCDKISRRLLQKLNAFAIFCPPSCLRLRLLPGNYLQMPKSKTQLGPPLPGDLGPRILVAGEAARRQSRWARQAREAGMFLQLSHRGGGPAHLPSSAGSPAPPAGTPANAMAAEAGRPNPDPGRNRNNQQRKLDFINQPAARSIYNDQTLQMPASLHDMPARTIIVASRITGLNSDLPGVVTAQVTGNFHDTVTGRIPLIPQGARLIGTYDSVIAFGQSRALLICIASSCRTAPRSRSITCRQPMRLAMPASRTSVLRTYQGEGGSSCPN